MVPSFLLTTYLNSAIFDVVYGITVITDLDAGVDITSSVLSCLVMKIWCKIYNSVVAVSTIAAMWHLCDWLRLWKCVRPWTLQVDQVSCFYDKVIDFIHISPWLVEYHKVLHASVLEPVAIDISRAIDSKCVWTGIRRFQHMNNAPPILQSLLEIIW